MLVRSIQSDSSIRTTTVISTSILAYDSQLVVTLEAFVESFRSSIPITLVRFKVDNSNPLLYHYRINAIDGRSWVQNATYIGASDTNPLLTWPNDSWKSSEAILQRPIREWIDLNMRVQIGMNSMEIEYT